MKPSELLSAQLLDILFAGRNKLYGAYELRKTYSKRINTALFITLFFAAIAFGGATIASGAKKKISQVKINDGVILKKVEEKKIEEPLPEPEKKPEPEPVQTKAYNVPIITPDDQVDKPLTEIAELDSSLIGHENIEGKPDGPEVDLDPPGNGTEIIAPKEKHVEEGPLMIVEVPARFIGNWVNFLLKNLNAQVPVDNDAPPGTYSVVIQFVVDKEGSTSEINPLTHHGYGLEEEAVRVIKKAPKWDPAIQNGYKVKAFHRQVIRFDVMGDE